GSGRGRRLVRALRRGDRRARSTGSGHDLIGVIPAILFPFKEDARESETSEEGREEGGEADSEGRRPEDQADAEGCAALREESQTRRGRSGGRGYGEGAGDRKGRAGGRIEAAQEGVEVDVARLTGGQRAAGSGREARKPPAACRPPCVLPISTPTPITPTAPVRHAR